MRFLILIFLFGIVNAQRNYDVDLNNGIVEFTDISNSVIRYSYNASEISYREVGSNNFDICDNANCNGFDINVINNFSSRAYLMDSLNYWQSISSSAASSLWQTTNGFYEPKVSKPFSFDYQGFLLKNDSVNVGLNIPYVGSLGKDYGSYKSFSGIVDANVVGAGDLVTMGWINFGAGQFNAITVYDTTYIQLLHKNVEVKINDNGLVLPLLSADPTGEDGAMYFNTSMNKTRIYHGGSWHNNN